MQKVLDTATDRVSLVCRDGYLVYTLNSVAKVYGKTVEELVGTHQSELFGADVYASHIEPAFQRALNGEEIQETALIQFKVDSSDKYQTHLDFMLSPWRGSDGEIIGVIYRVLDKERHILDEELALTRQQLTDFVDASSDWRWEMDKELRFTWFSKRLEEIYGISAIDHIGKERKHIAADAEEHKKWQQHLRDLDERKPFRNFDYRIQLSDDQVSWGRISGVPIINRSGEFDGYRGVGSDISDLKRIELEADQAHTRFMRAIDHYPGAFLLLDKYRRVVVYNLRFAKFCEEFGMEANAGDTLESLIRQMAYSGRIDHIVGNEEEWIASSCEEFRTPTEPEEVCRNGVWYRNEYHHLPDGSCLFTMIDVTRARKLEQRLVYQAHHDALTKLPNRTAFEKKLDALIKDESNLDVGWYVGYLDLDRFKIVNDTAGHNAGDQLLSQVAGVIAQCLDEEDTLARLGGDEFGLLMRRDSTDDVFTVTEHINKHLDDFMFSWDSRVFSVNASIGLVEITCDNCDMTGLLSSADIACYTAKDLGRSQAHLYKPSDVDQARRHNELLLASGIKNAIEDGRFILYAQPIARVVDGQLEHCHYEVLIRMVDRQGELLAPGAFIPVAERFGVMNKLDRWVIENALQCVAEISAQTGTEVSVTINLSGQSLTDRKLAGFVSAQLQASGVSPNKICFELTETAAISNLDHADLFIQSMKEIGCKFALDDFGSGLSSFAYIKHFPVDYLKIDGSFVKDIIDDPTDKVMVNAINQMAHVLGMETIAEFVENDEILHELQEIGVDMVQGFGIGKPMPFFSSVVAIIEQASSKAA